MILALLLGASGGAPAASQDLTLAPAFSDDMESGDANWVVTNPIPLGAPWALVETQSHSPTHSWFTDDPSNISDKRVEFANDTVIPAGAQLSFWQRWTTENTYDGHVLEYSLDGGTTWTDILAAQGSVPADANRITQTPYNVTISSDFDSPIAGRSAWSGDFTAFTEVRVDLAAFAGLSARFRWRFASDRSVASTGVWFDDVTIAPGLEGVALALDAANNGVFEADEDAVMEPTWQNNTSGVVTLTGALSSFTGPAGATYTIVDSTASYGSIAAGGSASCSDCYTLSVTATARPATHWDAAVTETISPGPIPRAWTLHVGGSFTDVPGTSPFYRFVETILHKGVTGGCAAESYCPANNVSREQLAVFALVAKEGSGYAPPACAVPNLFDDVPETSPFCRFVEELANRGVVSGCGPNLYCPGNPVSREQMAVFMLATLDPTFNPPACSPPNLFSDVPETSPFCRFIEEIANRGIAGGCGPALYCPGNPVSREQMSVFLTATFGLTLYGD